jgi:hypothetical protein
VAARGYRYGLESGSEIRIQAKAVTTYESESSESCDSDLPSSPNPGVSCDYKSESSAML